MAKIKGKAAVTEHAEQVCLFDWLSDASARQTDKRKRDALRWTFSTLNGARLPMGTAMKCKRSGMIRGVPDVFLPAPQGAHNARFSFTYAGLWIEMKRVKGGRLSPEQVEFIAYAQGRGYQAVVAYGWVAAVKAIVAYLGLEAGTYHDEWDTPPPKRKKKEGTTNDKTKPESGD